MSHNTSWGIVAKLGTRAIQRRWLHARAMYSCWIMHEITLIGWPVASGRDYHPINSAWGPTVPTVIPMLLSNAQILRRGHARVRRLIAIQRHAWGMQSRPRAVHLSPSGPLSFSSRCHEQLSLSYRPSLQSLTTVVVGEMSAEVKPTRDDSSPASWCSIGGWKIVYEPLLGGREATVVHAVVVSWPANFFWTAAGVAVDRLPRSMMLQFSFVFVRVNSCPWFRPLS